MQNCTLMCPKDVRPQIADFLRETCPGVKVEGPDAEWTSIEVDSRFRLSAVRRVRPGDQFSRIVLGMHSHFSRLGEPTTPEEDAGLSRIMDVELIVGVVFRSDDDDETDGLIFEVAQEAGSCVFDGFDLLDGTRQVLLSRR